MVTSERDSTQGVATIKAQKRRTARTSLQSLTARTGSTKKSKDRQAFEAAHPETPVALSKSSASAPASSISTSHTIPSFPASKYYTAPNQPSSHREDGKRRKQQQSKSPVKARGRDTTASADARDSEETSRQSYSSEDSHDLSLSTDDQRGSIVDTMLLSLQSDASVPTPKSLFSGVAAAPAPRITTVRHVPSASLQSESDISGIAAQVAHTRESPFRQARSYSSTFAATPSRSPTIDMKLTKDQRVAASPVITRQKSAKHNVEDDDDNNDSKNRRDRTTKTPPGRRRSSSGANSAASRRESGAVTSESSPSTVSTTHSQPSFRIDSKTTTPSSRTKSYREIVAPFPEPPIANVGDSSKLRPESKLQRLSGVKDASDLTVPRVDTLTSSASTGFLSSRRGSKQTNAARIFGHENIAEGQATIRGTPLSRDRPSFFKRVFGSSSSHKDPQSTGEVIDSNAIPSSGPIHRESVGADSQLTSDDTASQSSGAPIPDISTARPLPDDRLVDSLSTQTPTLTPTTTTTASSPGLVKRPSSFFRRRKKSISDAPPTPVLPTADSPTVKLSNRSVGDRLSTTPVKSPRKGLGLFTNSGRDVSKQARVPPVVPVEENSQPKSAGPEMSVRKENQRPDVMQSALQDINNALQSDLDTNTEDNDTGPKTTQGLVSAGDKQALLTSRALNNTEAKDSSAQDKEDTIRAESDNAGEANPEHQQDLPSPSQSTSRKHPKSPLTINEKTEASPSSDTFHSARSESLSPQMKHNQSPKRQSPLSQAVPDIQQQDAEGEKSVKEGGTMSADEIKRIAKTIFDGDESIVPKSAMASWLGEPGSERERIRQAYMTLFQWEDKNILASLRILCNRLYLRGESQQVDRILDTFTKHWCQCNPKHGFKLEDVVHTICYSILMLNTDLHQAEIETKMTKAQFVRNVMPTLDRLVIDAVPESFTSTNKRSSLMPRVTNSDQRPTLPPKSSSMQATNQSDAVSHKAAQTAAVSLEPTSEATDLGPSMLSLVDYNVHGDGGPLVRAPFIGKLSTWESQVEVILKDFYQRLREEPLPLYNIESEVKQTGVEALLTGNMLAAPNSGLRRSPSVLSKAGSEHQMPVSRGRNLDSHMVTGPRWQSKPRSRPRLFPSSTVAASLSSRRSSIDAQSSITTPSATSAWSRFSSLGRTTLSTNSFASNFFPNTGSEMPSVGFANALSQAIIREEGHGADDESLRAAPLLEDESLELHGAPWAKEGMLKHKHHLDAPDKRARNKSWAETFAVIEKGTMRLFSFNMNAKSLRQKAKLQKSVSGNNVVGGGNWTDSAENLATFVLRQIVATALPEPGYSKTRPHVWALSLPSGAVHLFECGTPDIVREFVATANYWSARLSKEPLGGGVSNIEYGWSESIVNSVRHFLPGSASPIAEDGDDNAKGASAADSSGTGTQHPIAGARPSYEAHHEATSASSILKPRASFQQSIRSARSSIDHTHGAGHLFGVNLAAASQTNTSLATSSSMHHNHSFSKTVPSSITNPHDRIHIHTYTPPASSTVSSSTLLECDQLHALKGYVERTERELAAHNELRGLVCLAYGSRSVNSTKAMRNWEAKSLYLLRELVKFQVYVDALLDAEKKKDALDKDKIKDKVEQDEKEDEKDKEDKEAGEKSNGEADV